MKACKICLEVKTFDFFYKSSPTVYASYCKSCAHEKVRQYRKNNPEKYKAYVHAYEAANKEQALSRKANWYKANIDRVVAYNKENKDHIRQRQTEYRKKNPHLWAESKAQRRAAELKRTPKWLSKFDKLKIKCLYQVAAMRTRESGYVWHVDHIIPLRGKLVSGLHVPNNLRVIPASENLEKKNSFVV